jgi:hypothetical protein
MAISGKLQGQDQSKETGRLLSCDGAAGKGSEPRDQLPWSGRIAFRTTNGRPHFSDTAKYLELSPYNAEALMEAFGDEPTTWAGQRVMLVPEEYKPGNFGIRLAMASDPF